MNYINLKKKEYVYYWEICEGGEVKIMSNKLEIEFEARESEWWNEVPNGRVYQDKH